MPYLYLAPWEWNTSAPEGPFWKAPSPFTIGVCDIRGPQRSGQPGPTPQGYGLFTLSQPDPNLDMALGDLDTLLTHGQRLDLAQRLGLRPGAIASQKVDDFIWELLTLHADPTGQTGWKPLMPTAQGSLERHLGGFATVRRSYDPVQHPLVLDLARLDFQRNRLDFEAVGSNWHLAVLRALESKYRRAGLTARELAPDLEDQLRRFVAGGATITDDFNRTDESLDAGPWVEIDGNWSVTSNEVERTTQTATAFPACCHHTTSLASDDHFAEIVYKTQENNFSFMGGAARASGTSDTNENLYFSRIRARNSDRVLAKSINGTHTDLASDASGSGPPQTVKTEANGSTIKLFDAGVEVHSVTDTDLTGTLTVGLAGHNNRASTGDDFDAADLAAGADVRKHVISAYARANG